jgi:hypothetical protein
MKKTITLITMIAAALTASSQSHVETFESFTLSPNSAYTNTNSVPFEGTSAEFQYTYNTNFDFWSGGFSYTNKYDSSTAGFTNMYGVKPYKGYNNSDKYVVGKDRGVIKLKSPYTGFEGMYITNTTYAYKSMLLGDAFAKKFGGTSGNDPDFLKITIKGYVNGTMKSDSVEFYLADFRFSNNSQDYIVSNWQWVNTNTLGKVDSIRFFMYSSDVGSFGINTPLFFGLDNITASPDFVGLAENNKRYEVSVYPNPANNVLNVEVDEPVQFELTDMNSRLVLNGSLDSTNNTIQISTLEPGIYLLKISGDKGSSVKKIIKN